MSSLFRDLGNCKISFWVCPIPGHSRGDWRTELVQTVAWDGGVARCLAPNCGRTSTNPIPDDGRTWWILSSDAMEPQVYEARNGRAALAAYRRDLTAAELVNGRSGRETRQWLAVAGLRVLAGPFGTRKAYEFDLAQRYAYAITRFKDFDIDIRPDAAGDCLPEFQAQLSAEDAARIRRDVRARYLPKPQAEDES